MDCVKQNCTGSYSYSVQEMADLLGVSDDTVYTLIKRDLIETFEVDTWMRIRKDVFEKWYKSQTKYRTREDRERDAELENSSIPFPQMARMLGITRDEVYAIIGKKRNQGQEIQEDSNLCVIYLSALYTFYTMVTAIVDLIKFRRLGSPILSAAKVLNFVAAMMSILGLQTAMIARFSENKEDF